MNDKNCEDEYAKLWQMYGELEDERDRLWEALDAIRYYGRLAYSPDAYKMVEIADTALKEGTDDRSD